MSRETITGTLKVTHITKRNHAQTIGDLIGELFLGDLRRNDKLSDEQYRRFYYAPMYWVKGTGKRNDRDTGEFLYKFKTNRHGLVYGAIDRTMNGASITVTATMEEWANGNGAWLVRPKVEKIESGAT